MVEALQTDYSVRQICETLGFNRSNLYYHPKSDPSEVGLREEIEALSLRYPTYGYRRITALLVSKGYSVGYRRVARMMKAANLSRKKKFTSMTMRTSTKRKPELGILSHRCITRNARIRR